jgi:hypothetical protein
VCLLRGMPFSEAKLKPFVRVCSSLSFLAVPVRLLADRRRSGSATSGLLPGIIVATPVLMEVT